MTVLRSRWFVSLCGTVLLAGLVWFFGPLLPELDPVLPRLLAMQALLLLWALANAALDVRRRRLAAALDDGVTAGEEGAAIRDSMKNALAALRRAKGRSALAELPFYAIIGPPGAGKTTALLNAGLRFVLPDSPRIAGVGGTRSCDWWFTEGAVLIDTAGRYTTQDSDARADRAGWDAFLALLKRTRPRQPLNGVLVAIGVPDAIGLDAASRDAQGAAIAQRIEELESQFGRRLPVYVLFTKADLIAGFAEFFEDLDAEGRDQVWGETFPFGQARAADAFATGFRRLATILSARMPSRLASERRPDRRAPIAGFPTQFATLEKPLASFLARAVGHQTLLRGVYFTSGTQEGTPIDRLTGTMARAFGLGNERPAARERSGRSYFLRGLLNDVVFNEAALVPEPPARQRRRSLLRAAAFGAIGVVFAAGAGAAVWSAREAIGQVGAAMGDLRAYEADAAPLAGDVVTDADLQTTAQVLDRARALSGEMPAASVGFGWGQGAKLQAGTAVLYRDALTNGLLPRLLWRLEAAMRGELDDPARLYEATKVYLMLTGAGPLDPATVRSWMARDWARALPGEEPVVAALSGHLDQLLAEPLPPVEPDGALVAAARAAIGRVALADRVYAGLRSSSAATALPDWRPFDALGLAGATVFTRASGRPMTDGLPGLFTAEGYRTVLRPLLPDLARRIAGESWVEGRKTEWAPADLGALEQSVTARYVADSITRWEAMLADLDIAPIPTVPQAAQSLYILSSAESPMRTLLRSVAANLTAPDAVLTHFHALTTLGNGDGVGLERTLRLIADIQQPLAKIAALPVGAPLPQGGDDIGSALAAEAARQPPPVNRWLTEIASGAQALRTGNARQRIALLFNAPGGPAALCAAAVQRPPFAASGAPLSADEFARVFGPAGALDGFFNTQLKPFADTATRPWRPQAVGTTPAPIDPADLQRFQSAAAIRSAFFSNGQFFPSFAVDVTPVGKGVEQLVAGSTIVEGGQGPARTTTVTWPPPSGAPQEASVSAGAGPIAAETGLWALNRLVARGRLTASPRAGRQVLTFDTPAGPIAFDLAASGGPSPFTPGLLADFRCPALR